MCAEKHCALQLRRVHYHDFMLDVHKRLQGTTSSADPLSKVCFCQVVILGPAAACGGLLKSVGAVYAQATSSADPQCAAIDSQRVQECMRQLVCLEASLPACMSTTSASGLHPAHRGLARAPQGHARAGKLVHVSSLLQAHHRGNKPGGGLKGSRSLLSLTLTTAGGRGAGAGDQGAVPGRGVCD